MIYFVEEEFSEHVKKIIDNYDGDEQFIITIFTEKRDDGYKISIPLRDYAKENSPHFRVRDNKSSSVGTLFLRNKVTMRVITYRAFEYRGKLETTSQSINNNLKKIKNTKLAYFDKNMFYHHPLMYEHILKDCPDIEKYRDIDDE